MASWRGMGEGGVGEGGEGGGDSAEYQGGGEGVG